MMMRSRGMARARPATAITNPEEEGADGRGGNRGARTEQTTGTPFSFVRRGEIETANRVGVDEGEGRDETA